MVSINRNPWWLTEINPEYSLEGLMLKLQYFGHLMQRVDSLEKTLMLGKIEGRRRKGRERGRWLVTGWDGWQAHGTAESWTRLSDWTTATGDSDSKESACSAGDLGSMPGSGRCLGEGNGYPLQCSCWRIPWAGETGRLQSMGLQRIWHDWATDAVCNRKFYQEEEWFKI